MFRAMAVDSSVLLLLYPILSGALGIPDLFFILYIALILHISIILIITLNLSNFNS